MILVSLDHAIYDDVTIFPIVTAAGFILGSYYHTYHNTIILSYHHDRTSGSNST